MLTSDGVGSSSGLGLVSCSFSLLPASFNPLQERNDMRFLTKTRILSALAAILVVIGVSFFAAPTAANAVVVPNTVSNSYLSNANILVCGSPSGCVGVQPSAFVTQNTIWRPTQVVIGPYTSALYRVSKGNYLGPWGGIDGGTTGAFLSVENLQNFFGGPINVEILYNDPR